MTSLHLIIDKSSFIPIYRQIEEAIRSQILSGNMSLYDKIPSENELSKNFDVSPMTVRQAMNGLVKDGYVYRERGKGTFVAPPRLYHPLKRLVGFSEDMEERGVKPGNKILTFSYLPATEEVARILQVPMGETILHIKRTRYANDHPVGYTILTCATYRSVAMNWSRPVHCINFSNCVGSLLIVVRM